MPYTVTLVDFPGLPTSVQTTAEDRFRRSLDKSLGERIAPCLKAFTNASESSADEISKSERVLAGEWAKAYEIAKTAGFSGLGDADEAYFEVRLG